MADVQRLYSVDFGPGRSGLATVGYTLSGSARTASGVSELAAGSGIYTALVTHDAQFTGTILWDAGTTPNAFAVEEINLGGPGQPAPRPAGDGLVAAATLEDWLSGQSLTEAETTLLPSILAAASRAIRRYCNRWFTLRTFDELYTVQSPSRTVVLNQFPVSSVDRCATGQTAALYVWNSDTAANVRASVKLATTGDPVSGFTPTGLTLTRYAAGAAVTRSVNFGGSVLSASDVAAAVNLVGSGWAAAVADGMGGWPAADLRPVLGAVPALGTRRASLPVHAEDLDFTLDEPTGILRLGSPGAGGGGDGRFGEFFGAELDDASPYGGPLGLRVVYTAGEATAPPDVQQACVMTVKAAIDQLRLDGALKSESDGTLSWTGRDLHELVGIPANALTLLHSWINLRA